MLLLKNTLAYTALHTHNTQTVTVPPVAVQQAEPAANPWAKPAQKAWYYYMTLNRSAYTTWT